MHFTISFRHSFVTFIGLGCLSKCFVVADSSVFCQKVVSCPRYEDVINKGVNRRVKTSYHVKSYWLPSLHHLVRTLTKLLIFSSAGTESPADQSLPEYVLRILGVDPHATTDKQVAMHPKLAQVWRTSTMWNLGISIPGYSRITSPNLHRKPIHLDMHGLSHQVSRVHSTARYESQNYCQSFGN